MCFRIHQQQQQKIGRQTLQNHVPNALNQQMNAFIGSNFHIFHCNMIIVIFKLDFDF